eukprot:s549_g20.t1
MALKAPVGRCPPRVEVTEAVAATTPEAPQAVETGGSDRGGGRNDAGGSPSRDFGRCPPRVEVTEAVAATTPEAPQAVETVDAEVEVTEAVAATTPEVAAGSANPERREQVKRKAIPINQLAQVMATERAAKMSRGAEGSPVMAKKMPTPPPKVVVDLEDEQCRAEDRGSDATDFSSHFLE